MGEPYRILIPPVILGELYIIFDFHWKRSHTHKIPMHTPTREIHILYRLLLGHTIIFIVILVTGHLNTVHTVMAAILTYTPTYITLGEYV